MDDEIRDPETRHIVMFHIFPRLPYAARITAAFGAIFAGLAFQCMSTNWFPGLLLVLGGNLLLLVRGYNNTLHLDKFDPAANWQRVDASQVAMITETNRKIKKWDRSVLDVSNSLGCVVFILCIAITGVLLSNWRDIPAFQIFGLNFAALVFPHLVTGRRSIFLQPHLVIKTQVIADLMDDDGTRTSLDGNAVEYYMLLRGKDSVKLPTDVKFKIEIAGRHPDFLGLYGQIVINVVSSAYPYFYVVMVAKNGFGLKKAAGPYTPPKGIIAEFSNKDGVEVLVIRQKTSTSSGYFTNAKITKTIFAEGLAVAKKAALRNAG